MQVTEITNYNLKSQTILNESWNVLTEAQRIHIGNWEKTLWPLMESYNKLLEAELTPQQIDAIFTSAEASATAGGNNKTALGKAGGSIAKQTAKITDTLNKLATQAQNSGPIKNFDAQFEKLKLQLKKQLQGNPVGQKVLKGIESWGDFAKESPAKSAFIIGAMTSLLAFASGGILSGAAIGFFIKMANNTMKGDKLSTAVGKGVKGAAIGAIAGALGDAISGTAEDMFPAEITQTFMTTNGEIDITQLTAMGANSIEDLDSEAVKELIQTRTAMVQMMPKLDAEASAVLDKQLDALNDKIFELEPDGKNVKEAIDNLQTKFNIEGQGIDVVVKQNTTGDANVRLADPDKLGDEGDYGSGPEQDVGGTGKDTVDTTSTADPDGDVGAEGTVKAQYSKEEMNQLGMDTSEQPTSTGITKLGDEFDLSPEQVEKLQSVYQMEKAVSTRQFMGTSISADTSIKDFAGSTPQVIDGLEGEYEAGSVFKKTIETKIPGSDKPWSALVTGSVEGVDAEGNIVYSMSKVFVGPEVMDSEFWAIIDSLPEDQKDKMMEMFNLWNETADLETGIDTFKQDMAEKIMQGAAAVALGGALATAEFKPAQGELNLKGGQGVKNTESIDYEEAYTHLFEQFIAEAPPKQGELPLNNPNSIGSKIGKAAMGAGSSLLKTVNKGVDAVGAAAQKGIGKTVAGVKDAGKQLANKVTKEKLMKAWKKAGEPTDTGAVMTILSDNGLADEQIVAIGQSNKVELDPKSKAPEPTVDEPVDADGDGFDDADANKDGTVSPDEKSKANYSSGMDNIKASEKMLASLADEIKKAGVAAEVKAMLLGTKKPPVGSPDKLNASYIPGPKSAPAPPIPVADI
jgi:hypothetical protein